MLQTRRNALAMLPRMMEVDVANKAARHLRIPLLYTYDGVYSPAGYQSLPDAGALARAAWGMKDAGEEPEIGLDLHRAAASPSKATVPPWEWAQNGGVLLAGGGGSGTASGPSWYYPTDEHGNAIYGLDGDIEIGPLGTQPTVEPRFSPEPSPSPTPTASPEPTPTPKPTPTPPPPKYTIDLAGWGGYAKSQDAYPEADELSRMPLEYLKQAQAQMKAEGVIYADDWIIKRGTDPIEADCVGMIVMPAMTWYSEDMFERLISTDVAKSRRT